AAAGLPTGGDRGDAVLRAPPGRDAGRARRKAPRARPARGSVRRRAVDRRDRAALERALNLVAFDIYGLSELIGPGVAGECEARDGLHIADDHFLPEIIDPVSGAVLAPGREGELVLTTLTKPALPLVRYRTGHMTTARIGPFRCRR